MIYIEAPNYHKLEKNELLLPRIFLAGGITNCKDWQSDVKNRLNDKSCVVYNPRRKNFDVKDSLQNETQIRWEHQYLTTANIVIFYFSSETVCPITLFELGARLEDNIYNGNMLGSAQAILVYCEPNYSRKEDVKIQMQLQIEKFNKLQGEFKAFYKSDGIEDFLGTYDVHYFDQYEEFVEALIKKL